MSIFQKINKNKHEVRDDATLIFFPSLATMTVFGNSDFPHKILDYINKNYCLIVLRPITSSGQCFLMKGMNKFVIFNELIKEIFITWVIDLEILQMH